MFSKHCNTVEHALLLVHKINALASHLHLGVPVETRLKTTLEVVALRVSQNILH